MTAEEYHAELLSLLRRRWALVACLWIGIWLAFYAFVRPVWPLHVRWLAQSGFVVAYGLWVLWRNLPANHRLGDARLLPDLGPGNRLSLVRGICIGLLAGFLFGPWPQGAMAWMLVLLYTVTDIADFFDGFLARRSDHVTALGSRLDIEFDSLGTMVVILLAVSFGQLPIWYLILGFARYFFLIGLWLRSRLGRPTFELSPSAHRRVFAGFQMGFLSVVLWPILPRPLAVISGTIFAAATGLGFLRDWLVVSGGLDPATAYYVRTQQLLYRVFARMLPCVWRVLLPLAMTAILLNILPPFPPVTWQQLIRQWGLPWADSLAASVCVLVIVVTPLITLGVLARFLSITLILPIGLDMATRGLQWDNGLALVSAILLQLLGPGPMALWPLEERYLFRHLGGR